jgi:hypothetical protein
LHFQLKKEQNPQVSSWDTGISQASGSGQMKFTTPKIESSRSIVREQEERVVRQRRKTQQLIAERHPADDAQARLLIMEQSLLSMKRFLRSLEHDLEIELSPHKGQTQKRIKATKKAVSTPADEIEEIADDFASQATKSVLAADNELHYLDGLAKAMRTATR